MANNICDILINKVAIQLIMTQIHVHIQLNNCTT